MKATKGFTLIELMIVVAIIGILAATAIPTLKREPRKDYTCVSGMKFSNGAQIIGQNGGGIPCDTPTTPTPSPR